ncbi:MAG: radical SAM protein [Elusimicrobia bacterium]|nr:radical SAM protein [Elusimicrobiota bacterium]
MKKKPTVKHLQRAYGLRPQARDFPMMCVLSFVYVCNARCPNCPYTNSAIRRSYKDALFMDAALFRRIADECGEHAAWLRISGGGEPMLHPEAVPLFEYAKAKGARVGLITNGSRFTEANLTRLLVAGVDMIEFSVDAGDPETYARVRPGLSWDRLVRTVRLAASLRNRLKARTKIIASAINQVGADVEDAAAFWSPLVDEFQKRKYLTWGINDPSRSADPTPYLPPEKRIPCPFLFERLNIDSRGKVMMCGLDIAAKTDMGNVRRRSIAAIWLGAGFERVRKLHLTGKGADIPLCRECPDWKYRSWKHNYWKIVGKAEKRRRQRVGEGLPTASEGVLGEREDAG